MSRSQYVTVRGHGMRMSDTPLDLTPRLECVLCRASFERPPADEHNMGQLGESATGLCSGCATDLSDPRRLLPGGQTG